MRKSFISLLIATFTLSACTGNQTVTEAPAIQAIERPSDPNEQILSRLTTLKQQPLAESTCGLFLWARIGNRRVLVISQQNTDKGLRIGIDGGSQTLAHTLTEGQAYYGIFEHQYFENADFKGELTLAGQNVEAIPQGARIKRAALILTDRDGYELALPLAGIIACKSKTEKAN